ncbi:MAG TPA: hypothetical protein VGH28_05065 [Polyangiaceae bacterium]|jgi:hypothetical protein
MNARVAGALVFACACGGSDAVNLFDDASAPADATAPLDASPAPDSAIQDAAALPDVVSVKDATPPKDAGNPYQDPGIACGNAECDAAAALCCGTITQYFPEYAYAFACEPASDLVQCAAGLPVHCDDDHDCPSGVCCGDLDFQGHYSKVSCKPTCTGTVLGSTQVHFCDPKAPDCDNGQTCKAAAGLTGYFACQ